MYMLEYDKAVIGNHHMLLLSLYILCVHDPRPNTFYPFYNPH